MWPTAGLPLTHAPVGVVVVSLLQVIAFLALEPADLALHLGSDAPSGWVYVATSLFAHLDAAHLTSNVASQLAVGVVVEGMHGHARFATLYLLTGIGGALLYRAYYCLWLAPRHFYLLGASAAVYGLLSAYAAHLYLNWAEMGVFARRAWFAVALFVACVDVVMYGISPLSGVAYSAHVGGGVYGVCLGVLVLRNVRVLRHERRARVAAAAVAFGVLTMSLVSCV